MRNKKNDPQTPQTALLAWNMFRETGEAGYYMLYHRLKNQEKE